MAFKSPLRLSQAHRRKHEAVMRPSGGDGPAPEPDWWDPNSESLCVWGAWCAVNGTASFADSLTDLTGNGNDLGDPGGGSTPAWDAVNGWSFDGNSDYLTTTFVPNIDLTQTGLLQYGDKGVNDMIRMFGMQDSSNKYWWFDIDRNNTQHRIAVGFAVGYVAGYGTPFGNGGIAGDMGYMDGVPSCGPAVQPALPTYSWSVYVGAINQANTAYGHSNFYGRAFVLYDCTLTDAQILAVATAMAAL